MAIRAKFGYYPNNFDLKGFCSTNNLSAEKVVRVLNLFILKPLGQEDNRALILNSVLLRKSVGNIYRNIIECLLVNGVIENLTGYEVGAHSRVYQLTDEYYLADGLFKHSIELGTLNKVLESKNKAKANQKYIQELKGPKALRTTDMPDKLFEGRYYSLIKWFRNGKLTIDVSKAHSIIAEHNFSELAPNKYLQYLAMIDRFDEKDYHLKSDKNSRFYTNITNLPKILRGCLKYDEEELVGLDVSNTQPLLLSVVCDYIYLKQKYESKSIIVDQSMYLKLIRHLHTNPSDLKEYKKLVESGKLYESFIDLDPSFNRNIVKETLVIIINDRGFNNTREKKIIRKALNDRFPTIALLLEVLKSVDHRYASWTLLSKEANMFAIHFADIFCNIIAPKDIPLFTIHDCFLTTKSNSELLESEIKQFFLNNYMIDIPLKREW
jgi:hypothetical protein